MVWQCENWQQERMPEKFWFKKDRQTVCQYKDRMRRMCGHFPVWSSVRHMLNAWEDRFEICSCRYDSEDHRGFLGWSSKIQSQQKMLCSRCLSMCRPHKCSCKPPAHINTHSVQSSSLFYMGFLPLPPHDHLPSLAHAPLMFYSCQVELLWPCLLCSPFLKHAPSLKTPRHPKWPKVLSIEK